MVECFIDLSDRYGIPTRHGIMWAESLEALEKKYQWVFETPMRFDRFALVKDEADAKGRIERFSTGSAGRKDA